MSQIDTPKEWKTHEDPVLGISIKHPEGWTTSEEPDVLDIIGNTPTPPDGNMTTVTCRVSALPSVQENSTTAMREYLNDRRGEIEVIVLLSMGYQRTKYIILARNTRNQNTPK